MLRAGGLRLQARRLVTEAPLAVACGRRLDTQPQLFLVFQVRCAGPTDKTARHIAGLWEVSADRDLTVKFYPVWPTRCMYKRIVRSYVCGRPLAQFPRATQVEMRGLEPLTSALQRRRSPN